MDITIIGAGSVGSALATGWARAGHRLTLGLRNPSDPESLALAEATGANVTTPAEAARTPVIVLALPWAAAESVIASLAELTGKIVVDCMNPIARTPTGMGLALGQTTSGAEQVAGWAKGAQVVKTLSQVGADVMADNARMAHRPVMFLAGDDAVAKTTVAALLTDLGFEPLDAGDLSKARLLEPFALVWINQAMLRGKGRDWAFAAIPNPGA